MARSKNKTYEEIKELIQILGYELIEEKILNINTTLPLIIRDKENYYFKIPFNNIRKGNNLAKFHKNNPYTIQNIRLWCKLNDKSFELISNEYINSQNNLQWKCLKDGEIFSKNWSSILNGTGCPFCVGLQACLSNCLATNFPEIANQWHSTFNKITPYEITSGSHKEFWWQCQANKKHIWNTSVTNRVNNKTGCPYCSGFYPSEDYNLLVINPKICGEWNYNKNVKRPEEYTPKTSQYAWWKCKDCGHEWETSIVSRSLYGSGCPECKKSKGEKECKRVFDLRNIDYLPQKEFDGLIGLGNKNLSYDFYLPDYNLLIEYQGQYHDQLILKYKNEPIKYAKKRLKKQIEHDRRKKEYALNNGYSFLEIWYWDFDNIETILSKELNNYK